MQAVQGLARRTLTPWGKRVGACQQPHQTTTTPMRSICVRRLLLPVLVVGLALQTCRASSAEASDADCQAGSSSRTCTIMASADKGAAIKKTIAEHKVVVWSKSYCPYCAQAKGLFNKLNVPAEVIELNEIDDGAAWQDSLSDIVGRSTVPQVFVGGQHVGGCDDTMEAYESGKLKAMLSEVGISI